MLHLPRLVWSLVSISVLIISLLLTFFAFSFTGLLGSAEHSVSILFIHVCGDEVLGVNVEVYLSVEHLAHEFVLYFVPVDQHTFSSD